MRKGILLGAVVAMALIPAALLAASIAPIDFTLGQVSFWLTVALAALASGLTAFCVVAPALGPKRDPYRFLGQWFVWLFTPLLWGIVTASLAFPRLRPLDLIAVLLSVGICRWSAHAMCSRERQSGSSRRCRRLSLPPMQNYS